MSPDQHTLVTFLLDRSGPMEEIRDTTIKAFNAYLATLKAGEDRIEFTLVLFNGEGLDHIHVCKPISSVPDLTRETYVPRAATPLIDATYMTILAVAESLRRRAEKPKVVISVQSGGLDNSRLPTPGIISAPSSNPGLRQAGSSPSWARASMPLTRAIAWASIRGRP